MRILMLSWEYPPRVVGGIAAHVDGLARAMARSGHDVVVFSLDHPKVGDDEMMEGVRVLRANADLPWLPDE
ncbi:MAG: glycogen/starch synthase, partial [Ilumatobacteraceae bacterium]